MNRRQFAILALVCGSFGFVGCGPRQGQLTGTVTYQGKPLASGEILFTGDESRGHSCPGVMVEVKNGKFRTPPERGQWGGPYVAYVTGYKGQDPLFVEYAIPIDLPQGDTSIDLVVPDSAGLNSQPKK